MAGPDFHAEIKRAAEFAEMLIRMSDTVARDGEF